jgi:hypothetical protein
MFTGLSIQLKYLRQAWKESRLFRAGLILSGLYFLLRLAAHAMTLSDLASGQVGSDLLIYLTAAGHFLGHQTLYLPASSPGELTFSYSPAFALAFSPFLRLTPAANVVASTVLHIAAYALLYLWWGKIFYRLGQEGCNRILASTLPLWLIFSAFWGDMVYLNVYVYMALLATLLIDALIDERLGWAALWIAIILQIKPQWAFAALLPLLLGRRSFFLRLMVLSLVFLAASIAVTFVAGGPYYGLQQYQGWFNFLSHLGTDYSWRGPASGFLGYNHSVKQIVLYLLGVTPANLRLADGLKLVLLLPLGFAALRHLFHPARLSGRDAQSLTLELVFALYLGAFLWLDLLWELTLALPVFTYLLSIYERKSARALLWLVFLPYALVDLIQLVSYLALGSSVFIQDAYVRTDPSIYVPVIMIALLAFYAPLVVRLSRSPKPSLLAMRGI